MSEGKQEFDMTQEPKKVFVNFLIYNIKQIEFQIFFSGRASAAIRSLKGLISSLSYESQKKLEEQYEMLERYDNTGNCTRRDIELLFKHICGYLHKTYLKEYNLARPMRPSKGFPGVPDS